MYFYSCLIVLMSLPPAAQWCWGWRGGLAATIVAGAFAAAVFFLVYASVAEPPPADWNPEAKSEWNMGVGIGRLLLVVPPAVAVLAGAVLAVILALAQFAIRRWKRRAAG